jgi:hypothetical protein
MDKSTHSLQNSPKDLIKAAMFRNLSRKKLNHFALRQSRKVNYVIIIESKLCGLRKTDG